MVIDYTTELFRLHLHNGLVTCNVLLALLGLTGILDIRKIDKYIYFTLFLSCALPLLTDLFNFRYLLAETSIDLFFLGLFSFFFFLTYPVYKKAREESIKTNP